MVYFFHHYELPVILQQAQLQHILRQHHQNQAGQGVVGVARPTTTGEGVRGPLPALPAHFTARLSQILSNAVRNRETAAAVQTSDSNAQTTSTMSQTQSETTGRQATTQTSNTSASPNRVPTNNMASQVRFLDVNIFFCYNKLALAPSSFSFIELSMLKYN